MVSVPVERIVRPKRRDGTLGPPKSISELVAVREIFPQTFRTAVRQRSGVTLEGAPSTDAPTFVITTADCGPEGTVLPMTETL